MKYFYILISLIITFSGCNNSKKNGFPSIYKNGRSWNYKVSIIDSTGITKDTFSLKLISRKSSLLEKSIRPITICYTYFRRDSLLKKSCTGAIDNDNELTIHPPRELSLDFTEIAPFPAADPRMKKKSWKWFKVESVMNIQKASFYDFNKNKNVNLAGYKIKQRLKAKDTVTLKYNNNKLFCYIIVGKNISHVKEFGQFVCKYYYNKKLGFIKMEYFTPWKEKIIIDLISTNF